MYSILTNMSSMMRDDDVNNYHNYIVLLHMNNTG